MRGPCPNPGSGKPTVKQYLEINGEIKYELGISWKWGIHVNIARCDNGTFVKKKKVIMFKKKESFFNEMHAEESRIKAWNICNLL